MKISCVLWLLIACGLLAGSVRASQTIGGRVVDEDGNPVAGVSVKVGSSMATTNASGQYQIAVDQIATPYPTNYAELATSSAPVLRFAKDGYQEQATIASSSALGDMQLPVAFTGAHETFKTNFMRWWVNVPGTTDTAQVILPEVGKTLPGRPWVLHCHFFFSPSYNDKFSVDTLNLGLGYVNVGAWFGTPENVANLDKAYDLMVNEHGFHPQPIVVGLSKGGHLATAWAIANPDKVSALYLDCPVLSVSDDTSWPMGPGGGEAQYKNQVINYFGSEAAALAWSGNPVDNLQPLANAEVPIIAVYGGKDTKVIPELNILEAAANLDGMGHSIELLAKPDADHQHGVGGAEYAALMQFLLSNTSTPTVPEPAVGSLLLLGIGYLTCRRGLRVE